MTNLIDSFVVSLGLDNRQYKDEIRQYREGVKRDRDEARKQSTEQETYTKRAASGIRQVRNEVVSLALTFAGATSIKGFVSDMLNGDAATSRLSRNLDINVTKLRAWELAAKSVGGSRESMDATFQNLNAIFEAFQNGDNGKGGVLAALGMTPADLRDLPNAILKLADARERLGSRRFNYLGGLLGIDQHTINLVEQGRDSLEKLIKEKERDASLTEEQGKQAEEFQKKLSALADQITGATRPAIYSLVDSFNKTGDAVNFVTGTVNILAASLRGLAAIPDIIESAYLRIQMNRYARGAALETDPKKKQALLEKRAEFADRLMGIAVRNDERYGRGAPAPGGSTSQQQSLWSDLRGQSANIGRGDQASTIHSYLRSQGFSDEQARGIGAGIIAEGGTPTALNRDGGGNGAFGIGQWRGARQKALFSRYGKNPTLEQQMEFLVYELKGGDHGGAAVRGAGDADSALMAYVYRFMRPGASGAAGDMRRGRAVLGGRAPAGVNARPSGNRSSTSSNTNNITVYANTTDGRRIGQDIGRELDARTTIVNANSGLE